MALLPDTFKGCKRNVLHHQLELFDYYAPQMKHICNRYVLHNHEAEEVMIQAFLKAFAKIDHVRNESELSNWLRDKMIVASLDAIFKKNRPSFAVNKAVPSADSKQKDETDWSKIFTCNFSTQELASVLNSIDPAQSIVFKLFFIDNYKLEEIAELLEADEESCRELIVLAKKSIQAKLYRKCSND